MDEQPSPLEQIREQLALAVGENAVFDGWTASRRRCGGRPGRHRPRPGSACHAQGPGRQDRPLHPGGRPRAARRGSRPNGSAGLKIREKIRALVWKRLEIMGPAREAVRRALAILAMPQNVPTGLQSRLAHGGRDVADRRRHEHRLQPLHQAPDARRRSTPRPCWSGSTTRPRAGPRRPPSSTGASTT